MDNEDRKRWAAESAALRGNGEDAIGPYPPIPPLAELRIGPDELAIARITPPCIVESYLYRDVATFPGPGGTGKTTLFLFESVHIVLGRPLYGLEVVTPGVVAFVTAEDRRELLVARLRDHGGHGSQRPGAGHRLRAGADLGRYRIDLPAD